MLYQSFVYVLLLASLLHFIRFNIVGLCVACFVHCSYFVYNVSIMVKYASYKVCVGECVESTFLF